MNEIRNTRLFIIFGLPRKVAIPVWPDHLKNAEWSRLLGHSAGRENVKNVTGDGTPPRPR